MTDRATILQVFAEYGFAPGTDPHGWRCYHPDRYGPCDCAEQVADAVLALLRPVEGCVLSPEARESAWQQYRRTHSGLFPDARLDFTAGWDALAPRLEGHDTP